MRVLLYSMWFAEFVVSLGNALRERHSVGMILCKENTEGSLGSPLDEYLDRGVGYLILPHLRKRRPYETLRSVQKAVRFVREFRPDVIHIQDAFDPLSALLLPFFGRIPVVVEIHDPVAHQGDFNQKRLRNRVPSFLLRKRSNALIAHGAFCRQMLIDRDHAPPERVFSIPLGALPILRKWEDKLVPEEPHSILFFGRMREYKGLRYLIEAAPLISAEIPDLKIILAGDGPELDNCMNRLVDPGRFELHRGFISNVEMVSLFRRASIVVLPYLEASQSAVLSIAFTFGKPVVATNVGGIPDIVTHGKEGYLVQPRNAAELANAVVKLFKDDRSRKEFGRAALEKAENLLGWSSIAGKVSDVYRQASHL